MTTCWPTRRAPPATGGRELQTSFDKAFIWILVARLITTNGRLAAWDIAAPKPRES